MPKSKNTKTQKQLFTMKVEVPMLNEWKYFAAQHQMPLSDVIKNLMNNQDLPKVEDLPKRRQVYVDPKLIAALNALGNNLNQITRRLNQHDQKLDAVWHLKNIEAGLEEILNVYKVR